MEKVLIKIEVKEGQQLVSGRELHKFLEIGTRFDTWFNRMVEYGFVANTDFTPMLKIEQDPITKKDREVLEDYLMTISMAKELAMIQRSEKGKQARLYFIKCEEALKSIKDEDILLVNIIKAETKEDRAMALSTYRDKFVLPLKKELKETTNKLEHKQEVINGISDELKIKTQRQFLNEIIKMKGVDLIKDRWSLLYKDYELHKRINLKARIESYNIVNKPKVKSKLEYIDEVLKDISTLYNLAVKLFESDFKDKLQKYIEVL